MPAGQRKKLGVIQQPDSTRGSAGEELPNWTTFATVWARVEPITGSEGLQMKQAGSAITHRITMLYHSGVTANMRFVWNSRYFYFDGPPLNKDERGVEMEVTAIERNTP